MNHCQFDHGEEVERQLLISSRDSAAALEPADASFHHVSSSILPFVQFRARLVASTGNDRFDPSLGQPLPDARIAVPLVARHRVGAAPTTNVDGVHQPFEARRFVALSRSRQHAQRHAAAIGHQMKLRAKASAGSSQGVVARFGFPPFFPAPAADRSARMLDPSTLKTLQSMRPSSSSSRCRR